MTHKIIGVKTDEEIINKCFEVVGDYQGFNHSNVKKILRKALKLKGEEHQKEIEMLRKRIDEETNWKIQIEKKGELNKSALSTELL